MVQHWINELMNLVAGNSRYVTYSPTSQLSFIVLALFILLIPFLLLFLL
jgi:hypothetical protein